MSTCRVGFSVQAPPSLLCGKLPRLGRAHGRIEACGADVEAHEGTTPHVAPEGVLVVDRHAWIVKRGETSVYGGASERPQPRRDPGLHGGRQAATLRPQHCSVGAERQAALRNREGAPSRVCGGGVGGGGSPAAGTRPRTAEPMSVLPRPAR